MSQARPDPVDHAQTTLSRLTLAQLKPLLQLLNATAGAGRKADIIEKISATLAQRVASYNEALRHNQTNVVDLYWRQLREVVNSVNSAGKGVRLVLYYANGLPALPSSGAAAAVQSSAMPAAAPPAPAVPSTSSYAYARSATVAPPSLRVTIETDGGGLKRKRDDEPASAAVLPPIKRPHLSVAPSTISATPNYHVTMPMQQPSTMGRAASTSRPGAIPGTNVNIEEIDDPFFRLAPYPPLASFSLEASSPVPSAGYVIFPNNFFVSSNDFLMRFVCPILGLEVEHSRSIFQSQRGIRCKVPPRSTVLFYDALW